MNQVPVSSGMRWRGGERLSELLCLAIRSLILQYLSLSLSKTQRIIDSLEHDRCFHEKSLFSSANKEAGFTKSTRALILNEMNEGNGYRDGILLANRAR